MPQNSRKKTHWCSAPWKYPIFGVHWSPNGMPVMRNIGQDNLRSSIIRPSTRNLGSPFPRNLCTKKVPRVTFGLIWSTVPIKKDFFYFPGNTLPPYLQNLLNRREIAGILPRRTHLLIRMSRPYTNFKTRCAPSRPSRFCIVILGHCSKVFPNTFGLQTSPH